MSGPQETAEEIKRTHESHFSQQMKELIEYAEDFRMGKMRRYSMRTGVSLILGMIFILAGAAGFGWYFLMEGNPVKALGCIMLGIGIPACLNYWASGPIRAYKKEFKTQFMPKLAKVLGNLAFFPSRGISENLVKKSGIIPRFDSYRAEDCFMGRYGGIKLILSEARLSHKKRPVFGGMFVLLDTGSDHFEGTTIITADPALQRSAAKSLKTCPIANPDYAARLLIFTNQTTPNPLAMNEDLLKELYEMSILFSDSPISAIFWQKRHIFIAIPNKTDMFECSNLFMPITTHSTALQCKQEIDQLLSIIDIVKLYKTART